MEFWQLDLLMGTALKGKNPMAMDDFTTKYRKTGFTRVGEIDSSEPLKLRVSICGQHRTFW